MKDSQLYSANRSNDYSDVLMIAHDRPEYLALALPSLLESGDETLRVWVWQNGDDPAVTKIIDERANVLAVERVRWSLLGESGR